MVAWRYTNESLNAIVKGLEIKPNDFVLAVGGSGDQAFSLLEDSFGVIAVDRNENQIDHINERKEYLKNGKYRDFLKVSKVSPDLKEIFNERNTYFQKEGRLDNIANKLNRIKARAVKEVTTEICEGYNFSKIYLSNVISWMFSMENTDKYLKKIINYLEKFDLGLKDNGLIYIAGFPFYDEGLRDTNKKILDITNKLKINENLTVEARKYDENWFPAVFQKFSI